MSQQQNIKNENDSDHIDENKIVEVKSEDDESSKEKEEDVEDDNLEFQ